MFRHCVRLLLLGGFALATPGLRAQFGLLDGKPRAVFFPPPPPIYGATIAGRAENAPRPFSPRLIAPDGLAEFVCDDFYPALSTRLSVPELSPKLETRLRLYREKRLSQVQALLNEFVTLHDATAGERERQLRAFAETQTPQLVALEAEAERLRDDIVNDGLFTNVDWNSGRRWKVGTLKSNAVWADAEAEFQVVRATAYYQKGLLAPQRGLLRELAMELQVIARKSRGLPTAQAESDAMFFSPETARFRLPSTLAAATREKIGVYNGQKTALKRELRQTILAQEGNWASSRTQAFEELAEKQWPQLKMLDALADEIRDLLSSLREVVPPPPPPWMPAGLLETIKAYNLDRALFYLDLKRRVDSVLAVITPARRYMTLDERIQERRELEQQKEKVRQRLTQEFQEQNQERFARLQERYQSIRQMLAVVAEKQVDRKTGRPLTADTLLHQHTAAMEEFATFGREDTIYTNYRIAMFQPGLSPEQRRLLFSYALVGLAQPLPGGEFLPQRSATRPNPGS